MIKEGTVIKGPFWSEPVKVIKVEDFTDHIHPVGKFSDLKKMIDLIQTKFKQVFVKVEINTREGSISKSEYEDKILEAIRQAGIEIKGERLE
jgi:hypothetical protein